MAFVLPNFNLTVNIWNPPAGPPGLPSVIVLGNLAYSRRAHIQAPYSPGPAPVPIVPMYLLLPALTDVRDPFNGAALQSILEIPAGSGRFYESMHVDDAGKGFANEHRICMVKKALGPWPIPIP